MCNSKDPFQGLIAFPFPANLTKEEIASAMREGRNKMVERYGAEAIHESTHESTQRMREHVYRVDHNIDRKGVQA